MLKIDKVMAIFVPRNSPFLAAECIAITISMAMSAVYCWQVSPIHVFQVYSKDRGHHSKTVKTRYGSWCHYYTLFSSLIIGCNYCNLEAYWLIGQMTCLVDSICQFSTAGFEDSTLGFFKNDV
jgi:hypothetical protein